MAEMAVAAELQATEAASATKMVEPQEELASVVEAMELQTTEAAESQASVTEPRAASAAEVAAATWRSRERRLQWR